MHHRKSFASYVEKVKAINQICTLTDNTVCAFKVLLCIIITMNHNLIKTYSHHFVLAF